MKKKEKIAFGRLNQMRNDELGKNNKIRIGFIGGGPNSFIGYSHRLASRFDNRFEFYVRLSFWKHAMIMEGVYVRYSLGYYGEVDEKEIDAFGKSTKTFANKAARLNLLEEIL